MRYAPNTPEGIALSCVKNHPSSKSARDLLAHAMVAYWLPFGLAASGVEGQALIMACFEAIGELEKQINLIRRVLLSYQTTNHNSINAPPTVVSLKTEETFSPTDDKTKNMASEDSIKETSGVVPKKAADLF